MTAFDFVVEATCGGARACRFRTPHGVVDTPAFMPVGTQATVKTLDPDDLSAAGARMILANTYHLHLRPGNELIRKLGGLHRFMGWNGPLLTDSGGFQVFSLAGLRTVEEDGVEFRSHLDGSIRRLTPEGVMRIQRDLGADVIMQFDHVVPGQSDHAVARDASERSIRWLVRCAAAREGTAGDPQVLLPIIQGGIHDDLRRESAQTILDLDEWIGFGIGGLSVGEAKVDMYRIVESVSAVLPRDRLRYLMGVGYPEDLVAAVARGVDLFDCVAPTRMGRNGAAFTNEGRVNIKRAEYRDDPRPLVDDCDCGSCTRFSRAYVRHLFVAGEVLGLRLLSLHNVHFLARLMRRARAAVLCGTFDAWSRDWLLRYHSRPVTTA